MFKFIALLLFVSLSNVSCGGYENYDSGHEHVVDYHSHPKYEFEYGVEDKHTGDNKDQWEHRDGHYVKGGYSLYEPDGTKRVVEYVSDKHGGFNVIVKRIGHAQHPAYYGHHEGGIHENHEHGHSGSSYSNFNLHHDHH